MKVEELRIGNKIIANGLHEGKLMTVEQIGGKGTLAETERVISFKEHVVGEFIKHCEGISITQDRLLSLGFQWNDFEEETPNFLVFKHGTKSLFWTDRSCDFSIVTFQHPLLGQLEISYIHDFQNIFYDLLRRDAVFQD